MLEAATLPCQYIGILVGMHVQQRDDYSFVVHDMQFEITGTAYNQAPCVYLSRCGWYRPTCDSWRSKVFEASRVNNGCSELIASEAF